MMITPPNQGPDSAQRRAFRHYLRTGRRLPTKFFVKADDGPDEVKFNPWHDRLGRFTFAPGGPRDNHSPDRRAVRRSDSKRPVEETRTRSSAPKDFSPGSSIATDNASQPGDIVVTAPARDASVSAADRRSVVPADRDSRNLRGNGNGGRPYLSSIHNEVLQLAAKYPPEAGTSEWTVDDIVAWKVGGSDIFAFKGQWVHGYRGAITAAANRFDLPVELVAGVAYNEVGGDPQEADSLAYAFRNARGRSLPEPVNKLNPPRDLTSFGNVSIQLRRAAESLGYGSGDDLTDTQRRSIIASLKNSQENIFVSAKHLSDLRDIDYRGFSASELNRKQIEVVATRYNRGPDIPLDKIKENLDYGRRITRRWSLMGRLIRQ